MDFHPFDPEQRVHRFSLNLPHWQQAGSTYFVTFRTADSLPHELVRQWLADRHQWLLARGLKAPSDIAALPESEQRFFHRYFAGRMERALDTCAGECLLRHGATAEIVANALLYFHGTRYTLHSAVVMPNHVHVLVTPGGEERLDRIVHSWKSFSATAINRQLGRAGSFWQAESYDHIVRNEESFAALEDYIRQNPVKARLSPGEYVLVTHGS